ncbi:MAG: glutamate 5-kinase [Candidatus Omnitrophota bacterium]|nr:glutamate 5-kinase [Candidatus Omnitrophota bacterium]MDZ4242551.1 glutamate 5-kinase [Candidatus Omnitrophota bacterium]
MFRKFPKPVKRIVVKIGSSVIATYKMQPKAAQLCALVDEIETLAQKGIEVVMVSSGAIVLGMGEMGQAARPSDLAGLQALAAIGQNVLMRTYTDLFGKSGIKCAQVLLTWEDFDDRTRYNNARHTLQAILEQGVVPIINENDTISTDEIKFGDNDKLSALVAALVRADMLIILSDVEGLYAYKDGKKEIFEEIREITGEIEGYASGTSKKQMSRGGMTAKLDAIKIATQANIPCVIAHGEMPDVLTRVVSGERIGTHFVGKEDKSLARQHWISFGAKPKGSLTVDDGAKAALLKGGRSLLLPGVVSWEGNFKADDVVVVSDKDGREIGRGISNYSVSDLHKVSDKKDKKEVIHVDNLVLCAR